MSQTVQHPAPASLTIFEKLELYGASALSAVEHAAVRLVGDVASAETSLQSLAANSPLVQAAWAAGQASAVAHGVPLPMIEHAAEAVLAEAKNFVRALSQPPPGAPQAVPIPPTAA